MLAMQRCLLTALVLFASLLTFVEGRMHTLRARDAFSDQDPVNNEGEDHSNPPPSTRGSLLVSFDIPGSRSSLAAYWTASPRNSTATTAFIMIHGKLRDGANYWSIMNNALSSAVSAKYTNADANSIVVAPEFYSTQLNSGQYDSTELSWADTNTWQAGEAANHPVGNKVTSIDAIDALVDEFSDTTKYPQMKQIVLVGHGGGGQVLSRYAVVGESLTTKSDVNIRYVIGDPSSNVYFTRDRPLNNPSIAQISTCPEYNTWRYGFDKFNGTSEEGLHTPQQYFAAFAQRDVRWIVGYQDTGSDGDETCMAYLQGGLARRDRNLSWWRYLNTLGGTQESLTGFPGSFPNLTTPWTNLTQGVINHRLTVVYQADHDAAVVFNSTEGRSALFDETANVQLGWRPANWKNTSAETPTKSSPTAAGPNAQSTSSDVASMSKSSPSSGAAIWTFSAPLFVFALSLSLAIALVY